jgi:hypothetical protein
MTMLQKAYLNINPIGEGHLYRSFVSWKPQYEENENVPSDIVGTSKEVLLDDTSFVEYGNHQYNVAILYKDRNGNPVRDWFPFF